MTPQLRERVVLVTGAAGAIGQATACAFLDAGYCVVGLDRDPSVTTRALSHFHGLQVDLEDERATDDALARGLAGRHLHHVVSIAGGALPVEPPAAHDLLAVTPLTFRASIEANLTTQFLLLRAALPYLRHTKDEDRSVTLTSSFNALAGYGMPAYSAAKAGLIGLMHALVVPFGAEGIRVNVVAPGTVRTPRTERIWAHRPDHFERLAESTALGRVGLPADVGRAYLALATLLTHVTGHTLVVDGGQLVKHG